jgi:hypothetical protein
MRQFSWLSPYWIRINGALRFANFTCNQAELKCFHETGLFIIIYYILYTYIVFYYNGSYLILSIWGGRIMANLTFDSALGTLWVKDRTGNYSIPATSGQGVCMNNPKCSRLKNIGPIPSGKYLIYRSQINNLSPFTTVRLLLSGNGDWGDWLVPLAPEGGAALYGRSGFYLHCGVFKGSAGCIDIGGRVFGNANTERVLASIKEAGVNNLWVQ